MVTKQVTTNAQHNACVPLSQFLVAAPTAHYLTVAAAHCGWRGLLVTSHDPDTALLQLLLQSPHGTQTVAKNPHSGASHPTYADIAGI